MLRIYYLDIDEYVADRKKEHGEKFFVGESIKEIYEKLLDGFAYAKSYSGLTHDDLRNSIGLSQFAFDYTHDNLSNHIGDKGVDFDEASPIGKYYTHNAVYTDGVKTLYTLTLIG